MSNLTIKEGKSKFKELFKSLNIKQIKGYKKYIQYLLDSINKDKNLKIKPIGLSNKNKCIAYCSE